MTDRLGEGKMEHHRTCCTCTYRSEYFQAIIPSSHHLVMSPIAEGMYSNAKRSHEWLHNHRRDRSLLSKTATILAACCVTSLDQRLPIDGSHSPRDMQITIAESDLISSTRSQTLKMS